MCCWDISISCTYIKDTIGWILTHIYMSIYIHTTMQQSQESRLRIFPSLPKVSSSPYATTSSSNCDLLLSQKIDFHILRLYMYGNVHYILLFHLSCNNIVILKLYKGWCVAIDVFLLIAMQYSIVHIHHNLFIHLLPVDIKVVSSFWLL